MSVVRRDRLPIRDAAHSHPIAAPPGGQDGLGVGSTLSLGLGPCQGFFICARIERRAATCGHSWPGNDYAAHHFTIRIVRKTNFERGFVRKRISATNFATHP
jgi:hypothetical protein